MIFRPAAILRLRFRLQILPSSTAKRLRLTAQGCAATLGRKHGNIRRTLKGYRHQSPRRAQSISAWLIRSEVCLGLTRIDSTFNPFRVAIRFARRDPRVASQPWAMRHNRVAVKKKYFPGKIYIGPGAPRPEASKVGVPASAGLLCADSLPSSRVQRHPPP